MVQVVLSALNITTDPFIVVVQNFVLLPSLPTKQSNCMSFVLISGGTVTDADAVSVGIKHSGPIAFQYNSSCAGKYVRPPFDIVGNHIQAFTGY